MAEYKFFSEKEFNNLIPSCSLSDMNENFMLKLDRARHIAGIPFVLNCAYRSKSWDLQHGRDGNSYHCKGDAVDIRCNNSAVRFRIVACLIASGIQGIGIYRNFIHADNRIEPCMFYGDK